MIDIITSVTMVTPIEIHYILDPVNIVRVNIEDRHNMWKVYTLVMDSISPGLLLFLIE
jgi:hypothetical protein